MNLTPETAMMGLGFDPEAYQQAIKIPVFHTSSFVFKTAAESKAFFDQFNGAPATDKKKQEWVYSRASNPNAHLLENRLKLWDGGEDAAVFSSGMSAIATTLLTFLKPGDALLYTDPVYGGSHKFLNFILRDFGIECLSFDAHTSESELAGIIEQRGIAGRLKMIFVETPANPTNDLFDIAMCSRVAVRFSTGEKRVLVAVDNTFMGPLWQHPLQHGADLVLYSATKYIGGHSDLIAGATVGSGQLIKQVKRYRTVMGTIADPQTCWLLTRSLETMKLRMEAAERNAKEIADFLLAHPRVEQVYYLGFTNAIRPAQAYILDKQYTSNGAMISFDIRGGQAEAFRFLDNLHHIKLAVSLGGTESLAEHPFTMTHSDIPADEKIRYGITEKMIRLSVGVENVRDLIQDLTQALAAS